MFSWKMIPYQLTDNLIALKYTIKSLRKDLLPLLQSEDSIFFIFPALDIVNIYVRFRFCCPQRAHVASVKIPGKPIAATADCTAGARCQLLFAYNCCSTFGQLPKMNIFHCMINFFWRIPVVALKNGYQLSLFLHSPYFREAKYHLWEKEERRNKVNIHNNKKSEIIMHWDQQK